MDFDVGVDFDVDIDVDVDLDFDFDFDFGFDLDMGWIVMNVLHAWFLYSDSHVCELSGECISGNPHQIKCMHDENFSLY